MPKQNPYYTKENTVKTEEIKYLNTEIPTFEEFMKTYEYDEAVAASYQLENNFQEKGYGPCQNSSCDCYCSAYDCICNNYDKYQGGLTDKNARLVKVNGKTAKVGGNNVKVKGFQHLIHTLNDYGDRNGAPTTTLRGKLWDEEGKLHSDGDFHFGGISSSVGANAGWVGGAIASGGINASLFGINDSKSNDGVNFGTVSVGGEIGGGAGGITAGYTLSADVANLRAGGFQANVGVDVGSGVSFGVGGVEAKLGGVGFSIGKKMGISTPVGGVSIDLEETCVIQ